MNEGIYIMLNLNQDIHEIINNSIKAVLPESAVKEALKRSDFQERLKKGRLIVASIGKAAWRMAKSASDILGSQISGVVITKYSHSMGKISGLEIFEAGHPVLDENTITGTRELLKHVKNLNSDDTVGSALFEIPAEGVTLSDMKDITNQLLACGADIVEINTIRKHLSGVKGGRFAKLCAPARVFMVVLSDVLGDRLDSIASGPAWPDESTSEEAFSIVKKYDLKLKPELLKILAQETPKKLDNVTAVITGSVKALCEAACNIAKSKGYEPLLLTTTMTCEAREAGAFMAAIAREIKFSGHPVKAPCAIIAGGETVVHLTGKGIGGRNQEFALSAAQGIAGLENVIIASLGSDGTDGVTDAAGGIVDGQTESKLKAAKISISETLKNNDSYNALKKVNSLLMTGPTGTNVNDLAIALII